MSEHSQECIYWDSDPADEECDCSPTHLKALLAARDAELAVLRERLRTWGYAESPDTEVRLLRAELAEAEQRAARNHEAFVRAAERNTEFYAELARLRLEADLRVGSVVVDEQTWTETRNTALRVPVLEDERDTARQSTERALEVVRQLVHVLNAWERYRALPNGQGESFAPLGKAREAIAAARRLLGEE